MNAVQKKNVSLLKLLRFVTLLIVPVFLALIVSFLYGYRRSMERASDQTSFLLEYQLQEVDDSFAQINDYLLDMLITNSYADEIRRSSVRDNTFYRSARNMCSDVEALQDFINSGYTFYFYTPRLNLSFRSSGKSEGYLTDHKVVDVVRANIDEGQYDYNDTSWNYYDVDGTGYFVQVLAYDGMYFSCWIRSEKILSFLDDMTENNHGFYAIVDPHGTPLTHADECKALNVHVSSRKAFCGKNGYEANVVYTAHMNSGVLVVGRKVLDFGDAGVYVVLVFVVFLVVLSFSVYVIYYFRHYIQEPLEFFQNHVNSYLQERKFSKRYGFAELNEVENAFSALEAQVRELKIDVYEEKLRRTRTELEYLQNQIKPHFFVNCFSIIYGMAQRQQFDRIQDFCLILSDYVRYLLTGSFKKVSLQRELKQIDEFLTIQNIRFHAGNTLHSDIDEELFDCLIPPVTLLTFVENTVKHNKCKRDDLSVTVSAEEIVVGDEKRLRMKVADNGIGLSTEALAANRDTLLKLKAAALDDGEEPDIGKDGEHIGFANVYRRLLLFYGSRADMDITSEVEIGTVVTMTIPIERGESPALPEGK